MAVLRAAFTHRQKLRGCCIDESPTAASPANTAPPFSPNGNTSSFTCTPGEGNGEGGCEEKDYDGEYDGDDDITN